MSSEVEHINGIFSGLPIYNLYKMEKRPRKKDNVLVKMILDKYYKENSPEFEKLVESLLRLMELEISPNSVKEEEVKAYFETFEQVNAKFGKINKLIETLSKQQKKDLYLSYSEDIINVLKKKAIPVLERQISKKELWNYNDPLIVPYLVELLTLVVDLRKSILKATEEQIDGITVAFSVLIGYYSLVLYGYLRDKVTPEVTAKRYAELVVRVGQHSVRVSDSVTNVEKEFSRIPIPY